MIPALAVLASCGRDGGHRAEAPPSDRPRDWAAPGAPSPLRRLTAGQYDRAVRALFPGLDVADQRFAADERVLGFDHFAAAQTPGALWVEQAQLAAVEVSYAAVAAPASWSPCPSGGGPDPDGCGRALLSTFGPRAFRRPVPSDELAPYLDFFSAELARSGDFDAALQLGLQLLLNDPSFLYVLETDDAGADGPRAWLSGHEVATRLALLLWDSVPDDELLAAAAAGEFDAVEGVEARARRMLDDPRAVGFASFHRSWMDLDEIDTVLLTDPVYPLWREEENANLRAELDAFVELVWHDADPTLAALLLDRRTIDDRVLAEFYAVPPGTTMLPAETRAGFLTRAGWLAAHANLTNPSPIQRGVFVLERMLCRPIGSPPPGIDLNASELEYSDEGTNRERYARHTTDPACAACHVTIDGIGFGFERYDSLGQHRDLDNGSPVDATGVLTLDDAAGTAFDGALELSSLLAGSPEVTACYARQWYRYATARVEGADDLELAPLEDAFVASEGRLRELLLRIVTTETFRSRVRE